MKSALRYLRGFTERIVMVSRRKHYRAVGLMTANSLSDVPAIVRALLSRSDLIQGDAIAEFESRFEAVIGGQRAVSFGSGRVAFAAILDALSVGEGDEVLIPGYTCVVVPNPVLYRGAIPVYVDIDRNSLNLDPDQVRRKITPRTKAIVVQHTFGLPADFNAIAAIARPLGIKLIEDCTHALGARYFGQAIGTLGDASFFSMEQSKLISAGTGGIAFTRNGDLARRIATFREQQCVWPQPDDIRRTLFYLLYNAMLRGPRTAMLGDVFGYYLDRLGVMKSPEYAAAELECRRPPDFLKHLANGLAQVGISQLKHLSRNLAARAAVADVYARHLPDCGYRTLPVPKGIDPVHLRFPLWVDDKQGFIEYLERQEIGAGVWFSSPVHPQGVKYEHARYVAGTCPHAEAAVRHVINLPCHPRMNRNDAVRVVEAVGAYRKVNAIAGQEKLCP